MKQPKALMGAGSSGAWSLSSAPRSPLPFSCVRPWGLTDPSFVGFPATTPEVRRTVPWIVSRSSSKQPRNTFALPPRFSLRGSPSGEASCLCLWLFGVWTVFLGSHAGFSDLVFCGFLLALLPQVSSSQT